MPLGTKRPKPNYWGKSSEPNRKKSQKQERRLEKRLGVRTTPNSGATPFASQKGDLQGKGFLWEAKTTENKRFTLTQQILSKVSREAAQADLEPAVLVTFESMPRHIESDWVCVPLSLFEEMVRNDGGK